MAQNTALKTDLADTFAVGQTWHSDTDTRQVELVTRNAAGETLVGYLNDTGTALATKAEFAEWVQDEGATTA